MELLQLKYFCDAAITENFSATAKKYNVPPSNISQSIKRLEQELGVPLFQRYSNKLALNEEGRGFYEKVHAALSLLEEARNGVGQGLEKGKLTLCVNTNRRVVMQTVERFRLLYPGIDISTRFNTDVKTEPFDLIVDSEEPGREWNAQKMFSEEILLALPKNHPLANREPLTVADLADQPYITMDEHSNLCKLTHRVCREYGFDPHIAIYSNDPFYIRKCVEMGLGLAFVPSLSWRGQFSDRICFKKISRTTRDTFVYSHRERFLSPAAAEFMKLLTEECQREAAISL